MFAGKLVVGVAAAVLAVSTSVAVANSWGSTPTTVTSIVDGDTIDVSMGGEVKRVRLLNVDAPETVHPDESVQCLGPEARAFLEGLIPVGTEVSLKYDREKTDRYGRELAGVFVGDVLVNAELARAGLGVAVLFEPNGTYYDQVRNAQQEAMAAGRGLFDEAIGCTLPGQVAQVEADASELLATQATGLEEMESHASGLAETLAVVTALSAMLSSDSDGFVAIVHRDNAALHRSLAGLEERLRRAQDTTQRAIQKEEERIEAERLEAERREAERLEAERREAERKAAQERLEREQREAERRAAEQRSKSSGSSGGGTRSGGSGSGSGSSGGKDGYTGCRAYGGKYPPNAIDSKGRPYTKIDCITKRPIGG